MAEPESDRVEGKTILVVDDEAPLADVMACELEDEGYDVLQAHNGAAALEMMEGAETDLVVTDFMMPKMTGLELARAIRANADSAGLPIILVSGANGSIGRDHPELFDAVLDRPYPPRRLAEQVSAILSRASDRTK